jgi:hypothetical protein
MEYIYLRFKKSEKYVLERMDKTGQLINAIGITTILSRAKPYGASMAVVKATVFIK